MTRWTAPILAAVLLSGCALPISIPLAPLAGSGDGDDDGKGAMLVTGAIGPDVDDAGVGARLGEAAWPALRPAVAHAVGPGEDGETFAWRSEARGIAGTVTLVAAYFGDNGDLCRRLAITATRDGTSDVFLADACRGESGRWAVAPTETQA